ncbi:MAG: stage II sporulation protein M [Saprospiraceae bacterium]|nr:stage II sporulation protein M [Saprospiraceae bacterium]
MGFWLEDLPRLIHESRLELRLSLFIFSLCMAIGMLSCWAEPEFLRSILGDSYVEMTEANIKSGDPMAVYKEAGAFNMFLGITLNNILVAFITFVLGLFFGVGSIGALIFNGVMVGAFQYFFIQKGLFQESFLTIWMHGAVEISSIVVAGGAGLTLGRGLAFPGTMSRERSFQLAARRGMSLMVGVVPLFIFAGFVESYLTRHTEAPDWLRAIFITTCFSFMLFYFAFLPWWKARKGHFDIEEDIRLTPDVDRRVDFTQVKTAGSLFADAFTFLRKNIGPLALAALAASAIYCCGAFLLADVLPNELFQYNAGIFGTISSVSNFFESAGNPWLYLFAVLAIAIPVFTTQYLLARWRYRSPDGEEDSEIEAPAPQIGSMFYALLKTIVALAAPCLLFLLPGAVSMVLLIPLLPLLLLWTQVMIYEGKGLWMGLVRMSNLLANNFGQMMGVFTLLLLCSIMASLLLDTGIVWHLLNIICINFNFNPAGALAFQHIGFTLTAMFLFLLCISLWAAGGGMQYFSALEANEAFFLRERLAMIGKRPRIRGLEREG